MATLLLSIGVIALCITLLAVKVIFIKGGRFPSQHIHGNPEMRRRGIGCAKDEL